MCQISVIPLLTLSDYPIFSIYIFAPLYIQSHPVLLLSISSSISGCIFLIRRGSPKSTIYFPTLWPKRGLIVDQSAWELSSFTTTLYQLFAVPIFIEVLVFSLNWEKNLPADLHTSNLLKRKYILSWISPPENWEAFL